MEFTKQIDPSNQSLKFLFLRPDLRIWRWTPFFKQW